tara:strand:+ start:2690 stop:3271 length:582 start_codon:yes stop_codon:yes gene_type:complete
MKKKRENIRVSRLPEISRSIIPEKLRSAFDELIADSGGTVPIGPGSVAALSPEMALRRRALSNYVRWELNFPQVFQELVILVTARAMDCGYVWNAHAELARNAGASSSLVDAIRERKEIPSDTPQDLQTIVEFTNALLTQHYTADDVYGTALSLLGTQNLIDVIALIGQYVTNSMFINSFELEIPDSTEPKMI